MDLAGHLNAIGSETILDEAVNSVGGERVGLGIVLGVSDRVLNSTGLGAFDTVSRGVGAEFRPNLAEQAGQAPQPWLASTRSATAICCSREAW